MKTVTVRDLLASQALHGATVVGGGDGVDGRVRDVVMVVDGPELDHVPPGVCAVLDLASDMGFTRRKHLVEIICRRLHAKAGRMLLVVGSTESLALSTARLADRLKLPVVALAPPLVAPLFGVDGGSTGAGAATAPALTAALLTLVHQPAVDEGLVLTNAARGLRRARGELPRVMSTLDEVLGGHTALISDGGALLAGRGEDITIPRGPAVPSVEHAAGSAVAYCPVRTFDGVVGAWLCCATDDVGPGWDGTALRVLELAAVYVVAWLANERLDVERDARRRSALLAEILHLGEAVPDYLAEYAAKLGWRLDGWHTGIHFSTQQAVAATASPSVTAALSSALAAHDIPSELDELPGGWSTWWSTTELPGSAANRELVAQVRAALVEYHGRGDGLPILVAGIGSAVAGPGGIASTLAQARQAAIAAAASRRPGAVEHVDELGAKRLLLGWYGSPAFQDYADQLLAPMLESGGKELLETVETYLDSGASPHATARRLGVHRNTVAQRIRKAEQLLGVPLAQADERLAVHLACRAVRLRDVADLP